MKYYSEITNKIYETREELEAAEQNHKEKLVAKAKEEELRKAELEKAVADRDNAKAEYETALKVCREALANWSKAESALNELQGKTIGTNGNNNSEDYADVINVVKHLAEQANKWFGLGYNI